MMQESTENKEEVLHPWKQKGIEARRRTRPHGYLAWNQNDAGFGADDDPGFRGRRAKPRCILESTDT
jgi:hypothetical protein